MSFTPFAITKFSTGQFQYFQPWQSPEDAFNPLTNAFVFRGSITKRAGRELFGLTGRLRYTNNEKVAEGGGGSNYSGTLSDFPITGTITFTALTSAGQRSASATATGDLVGALAAGGPGTSTIDFDTGDWVLDTGAATIAANIPIIAQYTFTDPGLPIMLITEYVNETSNLQFVVVNDTRRSAIFNTATELFDPISSFSQFIWFGDGTSVNFSFPSFGWVNIAPYSVSITDGTTTITDIPGAYPAGTFTSGGNFAAGSTIDYSSGAISINLVAAASTATVFTISGSLQGDYYTGTRANLFNSINWKPSDGAEGLLYMTNNVDRVTTFNGTTLSRFPYGITQADVDGAVNDILTTLDVKVYQESLLFIRPTLVGATQPEGQTIRWSGPANPTNFAADVAGPTNGGFKVASTSDWIQSASYLRDAMIIDCDNSTFIFRFTNNNFDPFRFDKINSTKSTNAPYGSVEYDTDVTSMGSKGLCYCDGVNKERYDIEAIDLYNDIDQDNFAICQGRRFDQTQQTWMIYPSTDRDDDNVNCDRVLVYNWLEETWATYEINLTCIGSARTFEDLTWDDLAGLTWEEAFPAGTTWDENFNQALVPWMLGGDADGIVYYLNQSNFDYDINTNVDEPEPYQYQKNITSQIVSKRWNPFVEQGMKAVFGYIDFYYSVNPDIELTLNYYVNNGTIPALTQTLTLDGTISAVEQAEPDPVSDQEFAWKRMYCQLTGQFLRLEILSSESQLNQGQFTISGIIFWARPAGRLTPGTFL